MKILIVGGGGAALSTIEEIIRLQKDNNKTDHEIILLCEEKVLPYYRPFISKMCGKNIDFKTYLLYSEEWYLKNNINIVLGTKIIKINFENKVVYDENKKEYKYDKLVLTTGAKPFRLPGVDYSLDGIFSIFNYKSVVEIQNYIKNNDVKKGLVIGGGVLGCEGANALKRFDIDVTIVELFPYLLPRMLPKTSSDYFRKYIEKNSNVKTILGTVVTKIEQGNNNKLIAHFRNGKIETYDIIVINVGVRANIDYLGNTEGNLKLNINRGILCNEFLETSIEDVYTAGDCIEISEKPTIMLWTPAVKQGKVLAASMFKKNTAKYNGKALFPIYCSSFDLPLVTYGNIDGTNDILNTRFEYFSNSKKACLLLYYEKDFKIKYLVAFNDSKFINTVNSTPILNKNLFEILKILNQ